MIIHFRRTYVHRKCAVKAEPPPARGDIGPLVGLNRARPATEALAGDGAAVVMVKTKPQLARPGRRTRAR